MPKRRTPTKQEWLLYRLWAVITGTVAATLLFLVAINATAGPVDTYRPLPETITDQHTTAVTPTPPTNNMPQ